MSGFKEYIKEFGFGFYFIDDFMVKVLNKLKLPKKKTNNNLYYSTTSTTNTQTNKI